MNDDDIDIKFGKWLRYELWKRGWSRGYFYDLSGVNGTRIRVLIDGTAKKSVTVRECEAFAKALRMDPAIVRSAALGLEEAPNVPDVESAPLSVIEEKKEPQDGCIPVLT